MNPFGLCITGAVSLALTSVNNMEAIHTSPTPSFGFVTSYMKDEPTRLLMVWVVIYKSTPQAIYA